MEYVKSSYILKIVFSYADEKQKLKLVKYNKSLQKKIDININNYIHFQGKYIVVHTVCTPYILHKGQTEKTE